MLFVFFLFLFLLKINTDIKKYVSNDIKLSKLELINKDFDNFLIQQKVSFINYDDINEKLNKFETIMHELKIVNKASKKPSRYDDLLENIEKAYNTKHTLIEHYKSKNSLLLNSVHYLFELNNKLSNIKEIKKAHRELLNKTLLMLMKFYINPYTNVDDILKNANKLELLAKKLDILELKIFVKYIFLDVKEFQNFNKLKDTKEHYLLSLAISNLHQHLQIQYKKDISRGRSIVMVLFLMASMILVVLLLMYKRSVKLKNRFASFYTAVENSYNSIVVTDTDNKIIYVNDMVLKETGYARGELIGQNPRILKSGIQSEAFYKKMHEKLNSGQKWEGEFINKRKDGSKFYEKASIVPILKHGEIVSYLAIKSNITNYILEKQKVEHMAYHDALTSLPNRTNLEKFLQRQLYVAKRKNYKLAVLFIDLDRFKTINDTLGHDVGDELLIAVANRIKGVLRESDMLARIGGDEFVVVLDMLNNEYSVALVCEKIVESFQNEIVVKNHVLNITLSIGVSFYPDDAQDLVSLFKHADIAMYEAKESGRNNFKYYRDQLSVDAHNRLNIEQSIKSAIKNEEFYLVYQPKYDLLSKKIVSIESLARWKHKHIGFITPDKFITMAEEIGDILNLGMLFFKKACIDFIVFQKYCSTLETIAINVSAVQLYQKSFAEDIYNFANKVGLETKYIMLEITETHMMKNVTYSMKALKKLKEYGFKISMDDFGTGYSSLSYLKQFPIDEVKIDKSFVDNLPDNKDDTDIVKAIISLCKNMGYKNVAEGIENKAQEDFLAQNGCETGQGYYFCKPKTKDDILEFFMSTSKKPNKL